METIWDQTTDEVSQMGADGEGLGTPWETSTVDVNPGSRGKTVHADRETKDHQRLTGPDSLDLWRNRGRSASDLCHREPRSTSAKKRRPSQT